jgi:hypothetical protein
MIDLSKIDLGKDEAEQDERLKEYFLKTESYRRAFTGEKSIIIGRKGSGKSAIFKLIADELGDNEIVIKITPDQYSWSALKDYKEQGILQELAHTNSWKFTLCSAILYNFNERKLLQSKSKLKKYFDFLNDAFKIEKKNWFFTIVDKIRKTGIKTEWFEIDDIKKNDTPLRIINEIKDTLFKEWPDNTKVRILIDRLDDSWDGSKEAEQIIIGLLKASFDFNSSLKNKVVVTTFIRSDIYDILFFHDQDKLRQYEELILWNSEELKQVVCERVKVSLNIQIDNNLLWNSLFSQKKYRSKANAEKYIIDRTFKRPRDIISFVRMSLENAVKLKHSVVEVIDTRTAEEEKYSKSKYNDLIIEYQNQFSNIRNLLDSFSGELHKIAKQDLLEKLKKFVDDYKIEQQPVQILKTLFSIGFLGIKRRGKAGVQERGGTKFYYYYDDASINPLNFNEYYIHPSLRYHLNITETREKR